MKLSCLLLTFLLIVQESSSQPSKTQAASRVRLLTKRDADMQSRYLSKMTTCVRNRFGNTSPHSIKQERCAYRHFKRQLELRDRVACKLCDRYFYCQAAAEAKAECGLHHHVKATLETVADCPEIRSTGIDQDESPSEAVDAGWSAGGCDKSYMCSTGCRFASKNETCSLTCR